MNNLRLTLLLVFLVAVPTIAAPTVTLPDTGTYSYWIRTSGGTVDHAPIADKGGTSIDLAKQLAGGSGTLYILDPHTGGIATIPITTTTKTIQVTTDEFKVQSASPAEPAPAPTAQPVAQTNTPPTIDTGPSLLSRIVSWLIGSAVLVGVLWLVRRLVLTKGQPLVDIARKVGVDVPNPDDLPKTEIEHDGKYEPPPVIRVQAIPEAATKPIKQESTAGYLTGDDGTAHAIGHKTTTIGRVEGNDIILNDPSVSRKHARIESSGTTAELYDENSANGVYINGQKITNQVLSPGDRIHIGRVSLRYEK